MYVYIEVLSLSQSHGNGKDWQSQTLLAHILPTVQFDDVCNIQFTSVRIYASIRDTEIYLPQLHDMYAVCLCVC